MKAMISTSARFSGKAHLKSTLLYCGILASLLYTGMMTFIRFEGYSLISQTVSELTAIGAPSRSLWIPLGFIYQVLMIAFGIGLWVSAGTKPSLRVVAGVGANLPTPWVGLWERINIFGFLLWNVVLAGNLIIKVKD